MHLVTLYPNKSKDDIFGKYYTPAPSEYISSIEVHVTHLCRVATIPLPVSATPHQPYFPLSLPLTTIISLAGAAELRDGYLSGELKQTIPASYVIL